MSGSSTSSTSPTTKKTKTSSTADYNYDHPILSKFISEVQQEIETPSGDRDIIEIAMPDYSACNQTKFLEVIHTVFPSSERIDSKLFIKMDGGTKEDVHDGIKTSLQGQLGGGWWVQRNVTCVAHAGEYRPDVGAWNPKPTVPQRRHPIRHQCPPPNVWIEVVWNVQKDREHAITNITNLLPHLTNTEFVLVCLPDTDKAHPANPNAGAAAVQAAARPTKAPYVGYWPRGAIPTAVQWYKVKWNEYIALAGCGAQLQFNSILDQLC